MKSSSSSSTMKEKGDDNNESSNMRCSLRLFDVTLLSILLLLQMMDFLTKSRAVHANSIRFEPPNESRAAGPDHAIFFEREIENRRQDNERTCAQEWMFQLQCPKHTNSVTIAQKSVTFPFLLDSASCRLFGRRHARPIKFENIWVDRTNKFVACLQLPRIK